jgi:hypothetical protein
MCVVIYVVVVVVVVVVVWNTRGAWPPGHPATLNMIFNVTYYYLFIVGVIFFTK